MARQTRSFARALLLDIVGVVLALGCALFAILVWQGAASTEESAQQKIDESLDRAIERLRILAAAAEMTVDSAARALYMSGTTGAGLRPALESSLSAFEQRPELSYLGIVLPADGEYGTLERTSTGEILLWLFPGTRPDDRFTRNFMLTENGFSLHEERSSDGYDPRTRPFYRAGVTAPAEGRWIASYRWILHFEEAGTTPLWGFSYVKALRDHDGRLLGVLDADFDIPALNRFLAGIAKDYDVRLQIVELGDAPRLLGGPQVGRVPLPVPEELAPLIASAAHSFTGKIQSGEERRWAAARRFELKGGSSWMVIASREASLIEAPLRRQLYQVGGMGLAMGLGLVLISVRLARRFGQPLTALERSVAAIGRTDAETVPIITPAAGGFRETQLLEEALSRMAAAIRDREGKLAANTAKLLQAQEQQMASLALKGAIFDSTDTAIFSLDDSLTIIEWNAAAETLFGAARRQVLGRSIQEVVSFPGGPADWAAILATMDTGMFRFLGARGAFDAELRIIALHQDGQAIRTLIINDISARKMAEQHLRHLATHDELTGLPNRNLLQERLEQAIAHAGRTGRLLALLFLDLDRFKVVNDAYGHPFGDAVLKAAGQQLVALVRDGDTVARHGGDEFLILLTGLHTPADADAVARAITETLRQPLVVQGREIHLSGSVGMSMFPHDGTTAEALISSSDIAMYRAKSLGRNMYQEFTHEMKEETQQRVKLETCLHGAVAAGQLQLVYQPKVSLASGTIIGCEALLRWQHPELGMVPPSRFIPVAEDSGLIMPISDWVLRTACLQAKAWSAAGLPAATMAVNISARQILRHDVAEWALGILDETGLAPDLLELELTESLIAQDVDKVTATFGRLKNAGVKLSIDDFGTGYSSLSYLKHFPVDTLKIDQSFVRNMLTEPGDAAIVRAVIVLAHNLRFKVIAEGVETAEHCRLLCEQRCDEIQGYYISKPVPAGEFETMLRNGVQLPVCRA
ncbi:bifunctional diguanylate cyclase/phosphodiesterase [Thauera butanivorans]|uniref:bifunctional diguanylate cyclase/phosphodiesterase n=1 Tax=Thauera butanivorans TaxID=86174 RepID=UPI0008381F60|nr:EAL domain-containing protein [Thauera butanivorans]